MSESEKTTVNVKLGINARTALFIAIMPLIIFSSYRASEAMFNQKQYPASTSIYPEETKKIQVGELDRKQNLNNTITSTNNKNPSLDQNEKAAIQAYQKRMEAMTNQAAINESKKTVDIQQIQNSYSTVEYKGVVFNKIGFMSDGSAMSPEKKKIQVAETYKKLMEKGEDWFIKFPAKGTEKAGIFVFSDPTCGFCKKLHNAIPELNSKGITVNYLMYPRTLPLGAESPEAKRVINGFKGAWCSNNKIDGFNSLYNGQFNLNSSCQNETKNIEFPLFEHYFFGQLFNVQGTPAFFSSTGVSKEGFSTADKLINQIMENK